LLLSRDLTARFGRGFSRDNLETMRMFYSAYPRAQATSPARPAISETASRKSSRRRVGGTKPMAFAGSSAPLGPPFPLPWSHYVRLLRNSSSDAERSFYETEALRGGWTVRQLERQMNTQFYERTMLSRNKIAISTNG